MTTAQKVWCIACFAAFISMAGIAHAQRSSELSDDLPDSRTMAIQDKVDALFDAGEFRRAFFIYRNELAPLGDKYAQYMVGYMYLTGMGVDEDPIVASAWYRLAAERGTREFVAVRDQLLLKMSEDEVRRSDEEYIALRLEYCDLAVLLSSIKRNMKELTERTGSRVRGESSPVTVIQNRQGTVRSGSSYYGDIRDRLEARVLLLIELGDFRDMDADPDLINIHDLEIRVRERIEFGLD